MKGVYKIGRLGGIDISIHWTFFFLISWMVLVNYLSDFTIESIIWSVILFVSILLSILAHEFGHAVVARYFGVQASGIILMPIGAVASVPSLPKNPRKELLIMLAGPFTNLIISALLLLFIDPYRAYWNEAENIGVVNPADFLFQLQVINLSLAIFNLIPAFPLDGGRILRNLLAIKMNIVKATHITGVISMVIGYAMVAWGIIIARPLLLLAGVFIIFAASAEKYYLQLKTMAYGLTLLDVVMHEYSGLNADASVNEVAFMLTNNHSKYFVVMEEGKPVGTINRMKIIKSIAEKNYDLKIKDLMKKNLEYLDADMKVENVIEKLAGREDRLYPVMQKNQFAGVVNFRYIIEYLLIHSSSTKEYDRIKSFAGVA
ncbi:MAG: M50 family metallopeptidase [Bacteroidetes bacterium]|nr:M50 family metallopeptidase [Bacteroidota bacterium]